MLCFFVFFFFFFFFFWGGGGGGGGLHFYTRTINLFVDRAVLFHVNCSKNNFILLKYNTVHRGLLGWSLYYLKHFGCLDVVTS